MKLNEAVLQGKIDLYVEKEIQKEVRKNDKIWGIFVLLVMTLFGGYSINQTNYNDTFVKSNIKAVQSYYDGKYKAYCDSVVVYCDNEYNIEKRWRTSKTN